MDKSLMYYRFSAGFFYKKRGKGEGSEGGFLTFVFFFRENIDRKK